MTPWFKFLWETYRSVLDILRNNSRLEALYAMTATHAFQFCLTYKRTTEFRRLCDILRNHLANLNKCAPPPDFASVLRLAISLFGHAEGLCTVSHIRIRKEQPQHMHTLVKLQMLGLCKAPVDMSKFQGRA